MATDKTIEERVKETVARVFHREVTEIGHNTRFVEDLLAKSVNIVELSAILGFELGITIPLAQARRAKTVGEAVELVRSLLKK